MENVHYKHVVVSDTPIEPEIWKPEDHNVEFISLCGLSIFEMTDKVIEMLHDKTQKFCMSVLIFQEAAGIVDNCDLESCTAKIMQSLQINKHHKVAFGTVPFKPEYEKLWKQIGLFNQHLRLLNLQNQLAPLNTHKSVMRTTTKGVFVRGDLWIEFRQEIGVGRNLNKDGWQKWRNFLIMYHKYNFENRQTTLESKAYTAKIQPECLNNTPGYKPVLPSFPKRRPSNKSTSGNHKGDLRGKLSDKKVKVLSPRNRGQEAQYRRDTSGERKRERSVDDTESRTVSDNNDQKTIAKTDQPAKNYPEEKTESEIGAENIEKAADSNIFQKKIFKRRFLITISNKKKKNEPECPESLISIEKWNKKDDLENTVPGEPSKKKHKTYLTTEENMKMREKELIEKEKKLKEKSDELQEEREYLHDWVRGRLVEKELEIARLKKKKTSKKNKEPAKDITQKKD